MTKIHTTLIQLLVFMCIILPCKANAELEETDNTLISRFKNPPPGYGQVPLWWWVGEPLKKERILWQLDTLCEKGVKNLCVIYSHTTEGKTQIEDPPIFSEKWWDLWRWVVSECKKRDMTIGFSDYVWIQHALRDVGKEYPEMRGARLSTISEEFEGSSNITLPVSDEFKVITASGYRVSDKKIVPDSRVSLDKYIKNGLLSWKTPQGKWRVVIVVSQPTEYDALNPAAAEKIIDKQYRVFEKFSPGEVGKTINYLFQDELIIGRMPYWSPRLPQEFKEQKGYDLIPFLPALWYDIGPKTPKIRIDYSDMAVTMLEKGFFIPIFTWHNERSTIFGHDNHGRESVINGRVAYGDYFRTMRWYSAPGYDDYGRVDRRNFRDGKLASSIAHMYNRPRVWVEAFHSSGWGLNPTKMIAWLNEMFAFGSTLYDKHGLYYTTYGGWWEWAPPSAFFRQPYWEHASKFSDYIQRLSFLLSKGKHRCDVAVLYPITTVDADINSSEANEDFYNMSEYLFNQAIDMDFIDHQSLARAEIKMNEFHVSGLRYRILVIPSMGAIRQTSLEKVLAFYRSGGIIIAFGRLPEASDRIGKNDPQLEKALIEIFGITAKQAKAKRAVVRNENSSGGVGVFVPKDKKNIKQTFTWRYFPYGDKRTFDTKQYEPVKQIIKQEITRDVIPSESCVVVLHQVIGDHDVYFINNYKNEAKELDVFFRAKGKIERWNAWTGESTPVYLFHEEEEGTRIHLRFEPREAQLLVFKPGAQRFSFEKHNLDRVTSLKMEDSNIMVEGLSIKGGEKSAEIKYKGKLYHVKGTADTPPDLISLDGDWEFEISPTMNNRFGDFRLPPSNNLIGYECRKFRYTRETVHNPQWHRADFDDSRWESVTYSFGPYFWKLGPIKEDKDYKNLENYLISLDHIDCNRAVQIQSAKRYYDQYIWEPYNFSLRFGIERDPMLLHWLTGPHGLKGKVPEEFIDLGEATPGNVWYLWTTVTVPFSTKQTLFLRSTGTCETWINGQKIETESHHERVTMGYPSYLKVDCETSETFVMLNPGINRIILKLTQPEKGRLRAYAVINEKSKIGEKLFPLRWFQNKDFPVFDCTPSDNDQFGWYRFTSPPGLKSLTITARGDIQKVWVNGKEALVKSQKPLPDGTIKWTCMVQNSPEFPSKVAIRLKHEKGYYGGAAFPVPIEFEYGPGKAYLGDWADIGLATYSGGAWYRKKFVLSEKNIQGRTFLNLGKVAVTAELHVNGELVDVRIAPPWSVDISDFVRQGENRIEILVTNTLANHYSVDKPSPYVLKGQTVSGLYGPVTIETWSSVIMHSYEMR